MTYKYFNVKNGLTTGNITLNAGNSNITANHFIGTASTLTGNVTANYFIGDGSLLSNISVSAGNSIINGNSNVRVFSNSDVTISVSGQSNLATFALNNLFLSGNIIPSANVTYDLGNNTRRFKDLYLSGNTIQIGGGTISIDANSMVLTNPQGGTFIIDGSNAAFASLASYVTEGNQSNITSLGTLTSLAVSGNITSGNANLGNAVAANYFIGDGSLLTGISGSYSNANVANYLPTYIGNVSAGNVLTNNLLYANGVAWNFGSTYSNANVESYLPTYTGNVSANYFIGNGSGLTSLNGSNVTGQVGNALIAGTVYTNAQPNITSLGTLSSLTVTGNANLGNVNTTNVVSSGNVTITGNLTVGGNTTYINVETFRVEDPIIELGGGINGAPLTNNDGKDRGTLLHYYTSTTIDAFMGWDTSNGEFAFGSNVSVSDEVVTFNQLGNVRANYFLGNGSQLTGTIANANYALYAGTVITNAQPNITSVGTLSSLTVTGNITSGNSDLGNLATSNYFVGNGSLLTSINGSNVTGQVGNALIAGTVYTNAQPNITSLGTLTSLTVSGNLEFTGANAYFSNIANVRIPGGNANYVIATDGAGNLSWVAQSGSGSGTPGGSNTQLQFNDANTFAGTANVTYDKTTNTLAVTGNAAFTGGNVSLGSVSNLHITGGSANQFLQTDGSGNLTWATSSALNTITLDTFTGNGIQTSFTLSVSPTSVNDTTVNYNGATLLRNSYSISGANIVFSSAPANGSEIEVTTVQLAASGPASFTTRTYTGNGTEANYTVTTGATASSLIVSLDGVVQVPTTDYTVANTTLTFITPPLNNVGIQIRELGVAVSTASVTTGKSIAMAIVFGF